MRGRRAPGRWSVHLFQRRTRRLRRAGGQIPVIPNLQLERPVVVDVRESVEFAAQYVTVGSQDADPVTLRTARGSVMEAAIIVDSAGPSESLDRIQVDTHPIGFDLTSAAASMRASGVPFGGGNRRFRLTSLIGPWRFVVSGMPDGWYLKSLTINGSEMTDQVIDLGVGSVVSGEVVVSPKGGTIAGRISGERPAARASSAVIVFPQDREKWFERSRFIKVVRASQDGSFRAFRCRRPTTMWQRRSLPADLSRRRRPTCSSDWCLAQRR